MALLVRLLVCLSLLAASIAIAGETPMGSHGRHGVVETAQAGHGDCAGHPDDEAYVSETGACCAASALSCTGLTARAEVWTFAAALALSSAGQTAASTRRAGSEPEGELRPPRG
jgi:hypothetical protein